VSERLSAHNEHVVLDRVTNLITGPWPLLLAALVLVVLARENRLIKGSLILVPLFGTQIFFNLYVHHDYYQCALVPAYVAIMAIGIDEGAGRIPWRPNLLRPLVAVAGVAVVLGGAWTSPLGAATRTVLAHPPTTIPWESRALLQHTPPGAQILTIGCSWDSRFLYYGHRRGLMYPNKNTHEGQPPLSPEYVRANYQYVLNCGRHSELQQLPSWIQLRFVAGGLYEIVGT
jgi:hypothetical protein